MAIYRRIKQFGIKAVLGRDVLGAVEMRRFTAAENVESAYYSRKRHRDQNGNENWPEWVKQNPELNEVLIDAMAEADRL